LGLVLALTASTVPAGTGARPAAPPIPDAYGYRVFDQGDAECGFGFVDIEASGTPLVLSASGGAEEEDDGGAVVVLGAAFELYGELLTEIVLSSNGYVAAASTLAEEDGGDFSNDGILPAIPDNIDGSPARILPYHDDLSGFATGGGAYQEYFAVCPRLSEALGTEDCTVLQWTHWGLLGDATPFDMQAILYHRSFEIVAQIRPGAASFSGGTIGIQNRDATIGLQYRPDTALPGDTAVCFFDPRYPSGGPLADLEVSNADTVDVATPGEPLIYEIGVLNRGPSPAYGVSVSDLVPASLVGCSWTCSFSEGSLGSTAGSGDISELVDLQPDGWADYLLTCDTAPVANTIINTVTVAAPAGVTDPSPRNNEASDVNILGAGSLGSTLLLDRNGSEIALSWGASCVTTDSDYAVYQGTLGDYSSHQPITCSTGGTVGFSVSPPSASAYYLVVPSNLFTEGSYGPAAAGAERPASAAPCLPQGVGTCL
jgi:uncharacterized repeat protein (TIGR01451 family)